MLVEGARLRLRRAAPADAPAMFVATRDPASLRFMDWAANTSEAGTRAYLDAVAGRWAAGSEFLWVIQAKPVGRLLGAIACRLHGVPPYQAADLGFWIAQDVRGQGLGTEAAQLLVNWLQRQRGIVRIWATTDTENVPAQRVLAHCGLVREGVMRKAIVRPNIGREPRDSVMMAWVRE